MKKEIIIIVAILVLIAIAIGIIFMNNKSKTNLKPIESAQDLSSLIDEVYEGQKGLLSSLNTQIIDVTDANAVKYTTGLENGDELQYIVVSEPMMSSQAYSFVLVKVKDGVDANSIAKSMSEQVDTAKWICVSAEKLYATSSDDVVCLVMSSEEKAKPIYEKFKTLAGTIGEEYTKTEEISELP